MIFGSFSSTFITCLFIINCITKVKLAFCMSEHFSLAATLVATQNRLSFICTVLMLVCNPKTSLIRIIIVHALRCFTYISLVAYFGIRTHRIWRLALLSSLMLSWRLRVSDRLFWLSNSDRTQSYGFNFLWDNRIVCVMFEIVDFWSLNLGIWTQNVAIILFVCLLISKIRFHFWLVHRSEWSVILVGCRRRIRLEYWHIWYISDSLHQKVGPSRGVILSII